MKKNLLTLVLLLVATAATAKVKLPAIISDDMVLQQRSEVKIWGQTDPGKKVTVSNTWDGSIVTITADNNGKFLLKMNTPNAGYKTYSLFFDDGETVEVKGILVGEVWLASGQSNMSMPLKGFGDCPVEGQIDEVLYAGDFQRSIREFHVPGEYSLEPYADVKATWKKANPENVPDFGAVSWFFSKTLQKVLNVPVGIIHTAYGCTSIENWMSLDYLKNTDTDIKRETLQGFYDQKQACYFPTGMYNAMIVPLIPYTVKGFIWYQGESNIGHYKNYEQLTGELVKQWRQEFGDGAELPFYAVEIAPFNYRNNMSPFLREQQQRAAKSVPNTGVICTNDLVEPYEDVNIHPHKKREVGTRLAALALNQTYGMKTIPALSPEYKGIHVEGDKAYVDITNHGGSLTIRSDVSTGFEIAGADKVFHPATDVKVYGDHIIVRSEKVPQPVAVRYCFKDFVRGTVTGYGELPLIPFRTDNW